jgi:hypothetical protein
MVEGIVVQSSCISLPHGYTKGYQYNEGIHVVTSNKISDTCQSKSDTPQDPQSPSCEELEGFVVEYLEETLPSEQHSVFSQHLEFCPACKVYIENYQKTIELSQASLVTNSQHSSIMPESLVQAILASRAKT